MKKWLLIMLVSGCAATGGEKEILESWKGQHIDSVIISWGIPDKSHPLGDGRKMYEWSSQPTSVNTCKRSFIVDAGGVIQEGMAQGNNCCVAVISGYCKSLVKKM